MIQHEPGPLTLHENLLLGVVQGRMLSGIDSRMNEHYDTCRLRL
jgi:hypothetical protein